MINTSFAVMAVVLGVIWPQFPPCGNETCGPVIVEDDPGSGVPGEDPISLEGANPNEESGVTEGGTGAN